MQTVKLRHDKTERLKTCGSTYMKPTLTAYFLNILQGQRSVAQVLTFVLNLEQGEKYSLSRDKQYDFVFFLTAS